MAEIEILRCPHLVLSDAGGDDGFATGQLVDLFDDMVRLDEGTGTVVAHGMTATQRIEFCMPAGEVTAETAFTAERRERLERVAQFADMAPVHRLDLVDLSTVDVEVGDTTGVGRELRGHAGHPVVEARTHGDQQVTILDGVVGERGAVHAQHPHRQRMRGVKCADAHQRRHHRDAELGGERREGG